MCNLDKLNTMAIQFAASGRKGSMIRGPQGPAQGDQNANNPLNISRNARPSVRGTFIMSESDNGSARGSIGHARGRGSIGRLDPGLVPRTSIGRLDPGDPHDIVSTTDNPMRRSNSFNLSHSIEVLNSIKVVKTNAELELEAELEAPDHIHSDLWEYIEDKDKRRIKTWANRIQPPLGFVSTMISFV